MLKMHQKSTCTRSTSTKLTVRYVVPVGREELVLAELDNFEQLLLVSLQATEGGEPAQENVRDDAGRPHVDL